MEDHPIEDYSKLSYVQLLVQKALHPEHQVLIDSILQERVIEREREERAIVREREEREREREEREREREERAIVREREEREREREREREERAFQLQLAQLNKASPSGNFYPK